MSDKCQEDGRRRSTIVSFSKNKDEISIDDDDRDVDDFHMALGSYIPTYLAHSGETINCCGVGLPVLFERATRSSWWNPRFDSEILEGQYRKSSFSQIRLRFRYALVYLIVLATCWSLYMMTLGVLDKTFADAFALGLIFLFFVIIFSLILFFTRSTVYRAYINESSIVVSLIMCSLSLASVYQTTVISDARDFAVCVVNLLIIYTVIPLPLYVSFIICSTYSVIFEFLGSEIVPEKILLHVCVHLIGLHIFIMTNVRMRGTFMKVGQSLLVRKQLETEKQLKEKMIHSVMPLDVANWLLEDEEGLQFLFGENVNSLFRPFSMSCMKDVSILFADIVGFTKMSSKKTASQLVSVLNELFERFDELCVHNGCEKIATLGDCYYCVSGCPTARNDHAQCCVEMGLGMIKAISEFDREKHEDINMRVGVHTGTVLCGIVGRKRFKFDVWSNDVTLANKMESSGRPGRVHISEATRKFLSDLYVLEKADEYHGLETFFIVSRKEEAFNDDTTQATITSLTSNDVFTAEPSFETALMSNPDSLVTAPSIAPNTKSSSNANCTISPFDTISGSQLFSDTSSPTPPKASPPLLSLERHPEDVKATSLPNMFLKESNGGSRTSILGSGPLLTRKPLPSWKYSRLKLNSLDVENGKVQKTYRVPSSGETSPVEKVAKLANQLDVPKDDLSFCPSLNSRKDSGIRSNSRRSSIQPQLFVLNGVQSDLLSHRVSGYYTSSQSSLAGSFQGKMKSKLPAHLSDSLGACFQKIRKQSDLQLIRCVQDNSKSERSYFVTPPLKRWSLLFKYPDMEKEYRDKAHRASPIGTHSQTMATARFNTYFDITISFIVFFSVSLSLFLTHSFNLAWKTTFLVFLAFQLAVISMCLYTIARPVVTKKLECFLNWYPWHAIGSLLVSLPVVAVLSNYEFSTTSKETILFYSCTVFVGIVHYCNFTQLNCWMKSCLATMAGLIYLILVTSTVVSKPQFWSVGNDTFENFTVDYSFSNAMQFLYDFRPGDNNYFLPTISGTDGDHDYLPPHFSLTDSQIETLRRSYFFIAETYFSVFLIVLLVWFLNREFEISYRLSFHGNAVAARDKEKVQAMKSQAEKLLYNIIPKHVAEYLRTTARYRYSEDIKNVGVMFASVINFGEMYDESYMDGKECLRVLNELVSDFDDLLDKEQFSMVEKIKTIGNTFMAASGLNPFQRQDDSNEHLYQLMEFAFALQGAIDNFNTHLLGIKFILRVGFNFGDVTAGVIGTTKLHYDIWGDAVNIASRMDSTGVANRIQVPASCVPVLSQRYQLEHRGTVFVKGKDNMDVHLIKDKIQLVTETKT